MTTKELDIVRSVLYLTTRLRVIEVEQIAAEIAHRCNALAVKNATPIPRRVVHKESCVNHPQFVKGRCPFCDVG